MGACDYLTRFCSALIATMTSVLPEEFEFRSEGPVDCVWSPDPNRLAAYHSLTGAALQVPVTPYFCRHWVPLFGKVLSLFIIQVRCVALFRAEPVIERDELAKLVVVSETTVRRIIRWWEDPNFDPRIDIPADHAYIWPYFRGYIRAIAPAQAYHGTGSAPYQYRPLIGDLLHSRHTQMFSQMIGEQKAAFYPEAEGFVARGSSGLPCAATREASGHDEVTMSGPREASGLPCGSARGSSGLPCNPTIAHNCNLQGGPQASLAPSPFPPHPPTPTHACMLQQHDCNKASEHRESAGHQVDSAVVAELASHGVPTDLAQELCASPEGRRWARQQLEWLPYRTGLKNPVGYLIAATRGAAAGAERYRTAPHGYAETQEAQARDQKARERTQAVLTGPQATQLALDLAEGAADPWKRLLTALHRQDATLWGHLRYWVKAVDFVGTTLILIPEGNPARLRRELPYLGEIAGSLGFTLAIGDRRSA